ncbi:MAG: aminoacetone oxidase family FAD-binding enzyme [Firmicutes bacterium]|nr:aminoacetone oxidase family FAD-binding enzyme [Bacillota bacterium]
MKVNDIIIIGAGASGLAAAITAARINPQACILILEKKDKPGAKLAATGNGRCNITNLACPGYRNTLRFFESVGILAREENEGRFYPYTGKASDVVHALVRTAKALGIEIACGAEVASVEKAGQIFDVALTDGRQLEARKLLIAAGGKAAPQYGTSGDGAKLAKALGHSVTKLAPALSSIDIKGADGSLKGIRVKAKVSLYLNDKDRAEERLLASELGELQFTEKGISGVCVFNLSRLLEIDDKKSFEDYEAEIDFAPDMDLNTVEELLSERESIEGMTKEEILSGIVDDRIAEIIASRVSREKYATKPAADFAAELKAFRLKVSSAGGWKAAQCTRGGVPLSEVDSETMESRICQGLFLTGEVLDYDGPCGGFNLQHAWETGMKAGENMAK